MGTDVGAGNGADGSGGTGPGKATLTWEAPTKNEAGVALAAGELAGYKVYHGVAAGVYDAPIDVGNVTTYSISGLAAGKTHYFTVTAYNKDNNESMKAMEVSKAIP
jgi:hypothetical protein